MSYESIQLPDPSTFEGEAPNSKVLILASGHSTKKIMDRKCDLHKFFDKIIVCNYAFEYFDDIADYHLVVEKTSRTSTNDVHQRLAHGNFRLDLPRIVNWKGIGLYPEKYNLIKTARSNFNFNPNIRKYSANGTEGMLIGPTGSQGFSLGSILLCAMHFAGMIGAAEIYFIGADMCFKNEFDHFYNDSVYRKPPAKVKKGNAHKITQVEVDGKMYDTTMFFKESAELIDQMIVSLFSDIKMFDFSDGVMSAPERLDIDSFLEIK